MLTSFHHFIKLISNGLVRLKSSKSKSFLLLLRDRLLIIPGEGTEDIWEGGPKVYPLKGRGDEKLSTS